MRRTPLALALALVLALATTARADITQDQAAQVRALQQRLLATPSATLTLERWCAERHLADPARVVAVRLAPSMNEALEGSDVPFGRVVQPLSPTRRTLEASEPWQGAGEPPAVLFTHRALVVAGDGRPIALVVERYQRALLD